MLFGRAARKRFKKTPQKSGSTRTYATLDVNAVSYHSDPAFVSNAGRIQSDLLTFCAPGGYFGYSTIAVASSFYMECTVQTSGYHALRIATDRLSTGSNNIDLDSGGGVYTNNFGKQIGSWLGTLTSVGDVIGVAWDSSLKVLKIYLNGVLKYTSPAQSNLTGPIYVAAYSNGATTKMNFGATPFVYPVPTGFNAGMYNDVFAPDAPSPRIVLNPSDKNTNVTLSADNLSATATVASYVSVRSNAKLTSGKYYWEMKINTTGGGVPCVGVGTLAAALNNYIGIDAYGWCYNSGGSVIHGGTSTSYVTSPTGKAGDVIGVMLDLTAGTITFTKNGVNLGQAYSGIAGPVYPMVTVYANTNVTLNFGKTAFAYPIPSGYSSVSTAIGEGPVATAGDGQATVSFTAPNNDGGSPITGYTVQSVLTNGGSLVFGGGSDAGGNGFVSTEKYMMSNDTLSAGSNLLTIADSERGRSAASNTTAGIFAGGGYNPLTANTDKYVFAGDAVSLAGALRSAKRLLAGVGNASVGIFAGGYTTSPVSTADKYNYATDTVAAGTSLGAPKNSLTAAGNVDVGIFAGGYNGSLGVTATTDKYTYSGDVRVSGTALSAPRENLAAAGHDVFGIFAAGDDTAGNMQSSTCKYWYSNDTVEAGTSLNMARYTLAAAGNYTAGVFTGGWTSTIVNNVEKYTYGSNTVSAGTALSVGRRGHSGISSVPGWAGVGGGPIVGTDANAGSSSLSHIVTGLTNGVSYSFEVKATNAIGDSPYSPWSNSVTPAAPVITPYALFVGGHITSGAAIAATAKYVYGTNVVTSSTSLVTPRDQVGAAGNAQVGLITGGTTGTVSDVVEKYSYATEAVSSGTALSNARRIHAGVGNKDIGVFGGGYDGTYMASTSVYTYANNTSGAGNVLSVGRTGLAAIGTATDGFFAGGSNGASQTVMDKYGYSDATVTAATALPATRHYHAGVGNTVMGVFGGGNSSGSVTATTVKYTYASSAMAVSTSLTQAKILLGAASNASKGVFGGGQNGSGYAIADTTLFDLQAETVSVGTSLSSERAGLAGVSSVPGGF